MYKKTIAKAITTIFKVSRVEQVTSGTYGGPDGQCGEFETWLLGSRWSAIGDAATFSILEMAKKHIQK